MNSNNFTYGQIKLSYKYHKKYALANDLESALVFSSCFSITLEMNFFLSPSATYFLWLLQEKYDSLDCQSFNNCVRLK